jgi:hypothetical protein
VLFASAFPAVLLRREHASEQTRPAESNAAVPESNMTKNPDCCPSNEAGLAGSQEFCAEEH